MPHNDVFALIPQIRYVSRMMMFHRLKLYKVQDCTTENSLCQSQYLTENIKFGTYPVQFVYDAAFRYNSQFGTLYNPVNQAAYRMLQCELFVLICGILHCFIRKVCHILFSLVSSFMPYDTIKLTSNGILCGICTILQS